MSVRPISTAILSYGMSGEIFHAPLIHGLPEFQLDTIVQRSKTTALQRYPDVKIVKTIEEVLEDDAIEFVIVNTPNDTHLDFATRALEAGKHVVIEKPFTISTKDADALIALAKAHSRVLSVFQNRRWDGDFLTVKKIVAQSLLGRIVECESRFDRFRPQAEHGSWKEISQKGNGVVYNLGSHLLDQALVLFGAPTRIDARIGVQRSSANVDDYFDMRLLYDGFHVILKSSYLVKEPMPRFVLHGDGGSYIKYGTDPQEADLKNGRNPLDSLWGRESKSEWGRMSTVKDGIAYSGVFETIPGNYLQYYQNIFEAIREGKPLMVKAEESRNVIALIEAAYESSETMKAIECQSRLI